MVSAMVEINSLDGWVPLTQERKGSHGIKPTANSYSGEMSGLT